MATTIRKNKRRRLRLQERVVAPRKPATPPAPKLVTIIEYASNRGTKLTVDREQGLIPGVKILGLKSRNGREYLPEAVRKAAPLYEGAKVNLNHPQGQATDPRDYQDRMGKLVNVRVDADGGLSGDLRFNPKHALAEQLSWDAENAPENVGLSHNVSAKIRMDGNTLVVEEITAVTSVDLVADPGSTKSLFEYDSGQGSAARMPDSNMPPQHPTTPMDAPCPTGKPLKEDDPDMEGDDGGDPKEAIANVFNKKIQALTADDTADPIETAAQVKKLLQAKAKALQHLDDALGDGDDEGDDDGEDAEEHLRRRQAQGTRTVTEQAELNKVKAELDALRRKDSARKLLEAANLPPLLCDDLLIEELANADTAKQKKLIDRQLLLAEQLRIQRPRSRDDSMQEGFDINAANRKGPAKNVKELVESISLAKR
jgi:hypothetical protein